MATCSWEKDGLIRAQAHSLLTPRLEINQKCQEKDFQFWLQSKLCILPGEKILDLACGDGAQSIFFAKRTGPRGHVLSVDINHDSLTSLKSRTAHLKNISIVESDMMSTSSYLTGESREEFTLINCSFALPYASKPLELVKELAEKLAICGRLAISLPVEPHGMVNFCSEVHSIPDSVRNSIQFGERHLLRYMRSLFAELDVHFFNDRITFESVEDFMQIYSSSTYYREDSAAKIEEKVNSEIRINGSISFTKGSILLIGKDYIS